VTSAARPVLVYDGDCGFCTSSASWVAKGWDGPARAIPWQVLGEKGLAELGLTLNQVEVAAWWVDESDKSWGGHEAVGRSLRACRGWRRWAGAIILSPPFCWFAPLVYAVVARYRHRLPGGTPACRVR
jgi:predicted DCC family thiol-disulfide oxidoreductase YuxK